MSQKWSRGSRFEDDTQADQILKLECNVDDCTGEVLGFVMDRLFAAGAKEVNYTPVFMKKNRPGYLITVICSPSDQERMEDILFAETTTIGIRWQLMERTVLERHIETFDTSYGEIAVKVITGNGRTRYAPEYESVAAAARRLGKPFARLYQEIEIELETAAKRRG